MSIKEDKELEKILEDIEAQLELPNSFYDNVSEYKCISCGIQLLKTECEDGEDMCSNCLWECTSGIIDDKTEEELE